MAEIQDGARPVPAGYVPRRRQDVVEFDMGDGVILFDDQSSFVHHLNPSAAVIWRICDGSGSVEELARDTAIEFGLELGKVLGQIASMISELDALGLVLDARSGAGEEVDEHATAGRVLLPADLGSERVLSG